MENRCICCGDIIPEGTQYCSACGYMSKSKDDTYWEKGFAGDPILKWFN